MWSREEELEKLDREIKLCLEDAEEKRKVINLIPETIPDILHIYIGMTGNIRLHASNFEEELTEARRVIRSILPDWKGIAGAPYSIGSHTLAYCEYRDPRYPHVVEVYFPVANTPAAFLKEGKCGWSVEEHKTAKFVCNIGERTLV